MADLQSVVELTKLARELDVPQSEIEFLAPLAAEDLRTLREDVSEAVFNLHSPQLHRIAALTTLLPMALTTKIAEIAMGPALCAKIAAVLNPPDAIKLAKQFKPAFLTQVSLALDPIVRELPDATLTEVVQVAAESAQYDDAVTLLEVLSADSATRLLGLLSDIEPELLSGFVQAVDQHDAWPAVITGIEAVQVDVLAALANLPETLDPELLDRFVRHVVSADKAPVLVQAVLVLDDDHIEVVSRLEVLRDPEIQKWLFGSSGVAPRLVRAVLVDLGAL